MSLHKIALLILLAACARPAYSGSASAGAAASAPASSIAPAASPPTTATIRPSGRQTLSLFGNFTGANRRAAAPVLVIPAKEMTPETCDRIVEDLSIMSRIVEKNVASAPELITYRLEEFYGATYVNLAGPDRSVLPVLRSSDGRPKSVYIGGYGVLFSLTVKFPLVPPPEMSKPDKTAEPADQVWAAAQRELVDPRGTARAHRSDPDGESYKPEAVEGLKNALTAALKHATNIRDLEPEAWLTIVVQGPSTVADQSQDSSGDQQVNLIGARPAGRTLLTLRAKKADIDQCAKGSLEQSEFQKRVQITTY